MIYAPQKLNLDVLSQLMPGTFLWKKDINSVYTEVNHECSNLFGFNRKNTVNGFTDYEIPCKINEFAGVFQQQDKWVITSEKPLKILELHLCAKNQWRAMITTKNPLRNEKEIIGTFAYCIDITSHLGQIQNLLSSIHPIPLSTNDKLTRGSYILHQGNLDPVLTNRQMDCLYYFLRGKTAKETAEILRLSKRTVEFYLENLKNQFSCQTKAELIDKAISHGFMNVLPNCLFNQCSAKSIS